jgi:hypothetical protein
MILILYNCPQVLVRPRSTTTHPHTRAPYGGEPLRGAVDGGAEGGGGGFVTLLTLEADSEARASWARDVANALKVMTSEAATQVKAHLLAPIVNSRWVCIYTA